MQFGITCKLLCAVLTNIKFHFITEFWHKRLWGKVQDGFTTEGPHLEAFTLMPSYPVILLVLLSIRELLKLLLLEQ